METLRRLPALPREAPGDGHRRQAALRRLRAARRGCVGVSGAQRVVSEFDVCPIGDHAGKPWADVPKSFLRWMLKSCDYVARRPALAARVRQELAQRDRPPDAILLPGLEP